jgi:hypothetical protein
MDIMIRRDTDIYKAKSLSVSPVAKKKGVCSRILTPHQVGPICWFMATLVAMFYSQRSRKILLEASKHWNTEDKLFKLLKNILHEKYMKVESREIDDYMKFSDDTFIKVLQYLNEHDPKSFPYNPETTSGGFKSENYIGKLYKLLGVDYRIYNYNMPFYHQLYSDLNDKLLGEYIDDPKILIIVRRKNDTIIPEEITKEGLKSMREKIIYNGKNYTLDSVILVNRNQDKVNKTGHTIAGITCKGKKYIYNGWTRVKMNPDMNTTIRIPCELMEYDWNTIKDDDFCLNRRDCIPDFLGIELKRFCFNFSEGKRILVYVRKDAISATSSATSTNTMSNEIIERQKQEEELLKLLTKLYNTYRTNEKEKNYTKKLSKLNTDANIMSNKIMSNKIIEIIKLYNK